MSDLSKKLAENQKGMLKRIAPAFKTQSFPLDVEDTDSEIVFAKLKRLHVRYPDS